ncbi:MAG: M56 family metallopeptidase [Verrucomicrobiales bacterium]|jgi:beta-lactamase regulating signal transducer with metallopeptidase domain|nr:M56 family metallopeptidase [Verrucomicrobiales bacterium]
MNWSLMMGWMERAGFLLLAWHALALTVCLAAWIIVSGLRRRSGWMRSWIARAALVVAVLAPVAGVTVSGLSGKGSTVLDLTPPVAAGGERALSAVDWDKIAVWKPLLARVDFTVAELPAGGGKRSGARQFVFSMFSLSAALLLLRGVICLRAAWWEKNELLGAARPVEAGTFAVWRAAAALMVTKPPELRFCPTVSGPMLVGVFKPALLLPDESFMREPVLLHEFTHCQRRDALWRALALVLRRCAPLQFGFALLQRAMQQADEEVCDDAVIARGADRETYARLLLDTAERQNRRGEFALSMAARPQLERRVRRLLNAAWSPVGKVSPLWLAAITVGAAALTALGGWVYADAGRACAAKAPLTVAGENLRAAADREGAPATVSVDERWMSVVIPKIKCSDTDLAVVLENLEKMAADRGGKGLKLVLQEPPAGREGQRKLTLDLVEVSLLKILSFMSVLSEYKLRIEGDTAYFYLPADGEAELITMEIRTDADAKIQPEFFAPSGEAEQIDVTEQLRQKGIEFGKDCYAVFFPKLQQIVMCNSRVQHDALIQLFVARYKAAAARLKTRMAATIISECDFTDAKISDVVGYLQKQIDSQQADPKKSTINLLLQNSPPVQLPLVNLKLKNAPLTVVLDTIQEAGDYTYMVVPHAVFIVPTKVVNESIYIREFTVEPEFFAMKFNGNQSVSVSKELAAKGIEFKEGYSALYIPTAKKLTMRNTGEQMKKIKKLLAEWQHEHAR